MPQMYLKLYFLKILSKSETLQKVLNRLSTCLSLSINVKWIPEQYIHSFQTVIYRYNSMTAIVTIKIFRTDTNSVCYKHKHLAKYILCQSISRSHTHIQKANHLGKSFVIATFSLLKQKSTNSLQYNCAYRICLISEMQFQSFPCKLNESFENYFTSDFQMLQLLTLNGSECQIQKYLS